MGWGTERLLLISVLLLLGGFVLLVQTNDVFAQELFYAKSAEGKGDQLNYPLMGESGYGIAVDTAGSSVVTGSFVGTATFSAGEPNETTLTSRGENDVFVAKYSPGGALL